MATNVFYAGQKDYVRKLNDLWDRASLSLTGTSTSSVTVGVGAKSFTTNTDRQWAVGSTVLAMRTSNPTGVFLYGTVTSYNVTTGALVIDCTSTNGTGTYTDWTITVSGMRGAAGAQGVKGDTGDVGPTGATGPANTLTIGTVTTGAEGANAAATVTGTAPNQTLNLTLPRGATGASGETGPAGLVWQGAWASGTAYAVNDAVTDSGSSYRRKVAGAGTTAPSADATNWELIAQKGADGSGNGSVNSVNNIAPDGAGNVTMTKADIGLGNVDNTSDASKPVSTAQQAAIDQKVDAAGARAAVTASALTGDLRISKNFPTQYLRDTAGAGTAMRAAVSLEDSSGTERGWFGYAHATGLMTIHNSQGDINLSGTNIQVNGKSIVLGGNLTTSGAFASTFTMTGTTSVTFPTSGTLFSSASNNTQAGGTALAFNDAVGTEGRLVAASGALYIQVGQSGSDTTGVLTFSRNLTTATNFAAFNVYADQTTYYGTVNVQGALTLTTALAASDGGTGFDTYTVGDILFADTTTSLAKLPAGSVGRALISNGAGAAPSYQSLELTHMTTAWVKKGARVATTANLTASYSSNVLTNTGTLAALVIDGVTLATNNRVLVKDQTNPVHNGLYYVTNAGSASVAWTLTRVADCNFADEQANATLPVGEGTVNKGTKWTTSFGDTDTVGTSAINWYQVWNSNNPTIITYTEKVYAPAAGTAFTVDLANGPIQRFTTSGNITITLPAAVEGKSYMIEIVYGGAHTVTFAGGTAIRWPKNTAPTVTSVSGKTDVFSFYCPTNAITRGSTVGLEYAA